MALNSKQQMKPYHKNPRRINKKQFEQLKENLLYLGDLSGIVHDLNSNEIIGGNQRSSVFDVSKCDIEIVHQYDYPDEQGTIAHGFIIWKDKRYTYRQVRWTPKQCEQANITANRLGGEWDFDELANWDMSDLLTWGFEEGDFPFDVAPALNEGADAEPQIDKAEELRQKWDVQSGQMWQLGEHRIICGDCTDRAVVERVMGGEQIESLFFDPEWDNMPAPPIFKIALVFTDGGRIGDSIRLFGSPAWLFTWDCVSCWYTPNRPLKRTKHCLWYGDVSNYIFDGSHYGDAGEERTVWNSRGEYTFKPDSRGKHLADLYSTPITQLHANSEHGHSKPLDWIRMLIANCTTGTIFDGFSGSGVSIIACEQLNRKCRAVEISPAYVAVAIQRWVDVTGKEPILLDA